ncbi:hypothetical protein EDB92DRAFT_1875492 [Lactarius akahatsu]|uniref:Secreted protein n=1 Tax=Lactarius akahatsu TaxID=416441 RepID=A0AAD4QBS8_9AGAM|nr:hypothetical protein EDB92DRAFT_1875492 [Lactarius akahatsu]
MIQCLSIFVIYGPSLSIMCASTKDAELTAVCSPGALPAPPSTLTASMHGLTRNADAEVAIAGQLFLETFRAGSRQPQDNHMRSRVERIVSYG